MTDFQPLSEIPMDRAHMLDQATGMFRSVRDGLPELVKNAKDQYVRLGIFDRDRRQIVVLISPDGRHVGVLDLGGAREADFAGWYEWSSRTAGRSHLGGDIEAGHGNGGKAFMVRGAMRQASMCSSAGGLLTKMGFKNDDDSLRYRPGWFKKDGTIELRSLPDPDPSSSLALELIEFGLNPEQLPPPVLAAFRATRNFTFVHLDGVRDWVEANGRIREQLIGQLIENLRGHPQAALTIQSCDVWVMRGPRLSLTRPIDFALPEPYPTLEVPQEIPLPVELKDPATDDMVAVPRNPGSDCTLVLRTSKKNLKTSDRTKPLNVVYVRNQRNIVASWSVADLAPFAASAYVYGDLRYDELPGEALAGSDRRNLVDTPLVRALQQWVGERILDLSLRIQRIQAEHDTPEDRSATADALSSLRDLMRRFVDPEVQGGPVEGGTGDGSGRSKRRFQYGTRLDKIDLEPSNPTLFVPAGTTVPLVFRCLQTRGGSELPVRGVRLALIATRPGVVELTSDGQLKALAAGRTTVHLEAEFGRVRSNSVEVFSVAVEGLSIESPPEPLKQGERRKLKTLARLSDGTTNPDLVYEVAVDETELGRIGRSAVFTAGGTAGTAAVRFRYGPAEGQRESCTVTIGTERIQRTDGENGADIPHILLCGQPAPGFDEIPLEQRTHPGGSDYPTIIDTEPIWPNIIWINASSVEAMKVRGRAGSGGVIGLNTRTFRQFLALKCFEILRRIKVQKQIGERTVSSGDFFQEMAVAEMEGAPFLEAAYDLVEELRL